MLERNLSTRSKNSDWGGLKTLPEEDIGHIEDAWDEAKQDDILTEILPYLGQAKTYQKKSNSYQLF